MKYKYLDLTEVLFNSSSFSHHLDFILKEKNLN